MATAPLPVVITINYDTNVSEITSTRIGKI